MDSLGNEIYPYAFHIRRESVDDIRVRFSNEDGTDSDSVLNLTQTTALELLRDLAVLLADNPYAR